MDEPPGPPLRGVGAADQRKAKGTPVIRVDLMLQAPAGQIPDEVLQFLLWHELCHHVHPSHGHDAEFYRLLALWPDFTRLDHALDSLEEHFDLGTGGTIHR